jgi:hypothetical protein
MAGKMRAGRDGLDDARGTPHVAGLGREPGEQNEHQGMQEQDQ